MTELETTEAELDKKEIHSFGERLFAARKSQGLSVADIAKAIHLSEATIDALERSDVDHLPLPAFVQGYLRAYSKHLGIPEAPILEEYTRVVPHVIEAELHPRSKLPDEADSGSPFVKSVSVVLLITLLLAAVYGIYNYYSEMLDSRIDTEENTFLAVPEADVPAEDEIIEPYEPTVDGQYDLQPQEDNQGAVVETPTQDNAQVEVPVKLPDDKQLKAPLKLPVEKLGKTRPESEYPQATSATNNAKRNTLVETQSVAPGNDLLELIAREDSWTEVVDANDVALLYDLVQQQQTVALRGTAPFDIFLGNAPAMEIRINGIKIDMTKFVRSNKIAHFYVSTNDQQVVFH